MYNFQLINIDTDSISVCKQDGAPFSQEEQDKLLRELNSIFPETIKWDDDGYYKCIVVLRAKNYILQTHDGKVKYKGSAVKATGKPEAMKEMIKKIINSILENRNDFQDIYNSYIKEACRVTDIKRWSSRKTISATTLSSERTNESRIRDAIEGTEIVEGDKCHMFFMPDGSLKLAEQFDGNYDVDKLLLMIYNTAWTFDNVLDCELLFPNFKLKKMKPKLEELLNDLHSMQ